MMLLPNVTDIAQAALRRRRVHSLFTVYGQFHDNMAMKATEFHQSRQRIIENSASQRYKLVVEDKPSDGAPTSSNFFLLPVAKCICLGVEVAMVMQRSLKLLMNAAPLCLLGCRGAVADCDSPSTFINTARTAIATHSSQCSK